MNITHSAAQHASNRDWRLERGAVQDRQVLSARPHASPSIIIATRGRGRAVAYLGRNLISPRNLHEVGRRSSLLLLLCAHAAGGLPRTIRRRPPL